MKDESTTASRRSARRRRSSGASMFEMLMVIIIIGVLAAVVIPIIKGLDRAQAAKSKRNAQMAAEVSNNLISLDVAHVLPESLGGAEATMRLLKLGFKVEDGSMEGVTMGLPGLPESDIEPSAVYLEVVFDEEYLRLQYDASAE